jgi:hypothetical protein
MAGRLPAADVEALPRMRFDRWTLVLMVLCQIVQLAFASRAVLEVVMTVLMLRMYIAYHPSRLAAVVRESISCTLLS